jgi:hypothetical protein
MCLSFDTSPISLYDNYLPFYYQLLLNYFSPIGKKYFSGRRNKVHSRFLS